MKSQNKFKASIMVLTLLMLAGAGCTSNNTDSNLGNANPQSENRIQNTDKGDKTKVPEVEKQLGFKLLSNSAIQIAVGSEKSYQVNIYTEDSLEDALTYYKAALEEQGLTINRKWGTLPQDDGIKRDSAVYKKNKEIWGISVTDEGTHRTVNFQIQY